MSNENNYWKGLVAGTIIGGLAGAITALLLAPKSGKELRQDIAEKSQELYDKAQDYLAIFEENMGSVVSTTVNEGKERAQKIISSAKQQAESLLENADKVLQDAKFKATNVKDTIEDKIGNLRDAAKAGAEAFKSEYKS
jgi:gas vesicle protein